MFEKDIRENMGKTQIIYKPLDKRFYFLRGRKAKGGAIIGSESLGPIGVVYQIPLGVFQDLGMDEIIRDNYSLYGKLLNDSKIHKIDLNLNVVDILKIRFDRVYYFKQEQQYYLLNRLSFDKDNAKGEFVKIDRLIEDA